MAIIASSRTTINRLRVETAECLSYDSRPAWDDPAWSDAHWYAFKSTPEQMVIRRSVRTHKYTAIRSANSMGKTADVLCKTALDFCLSHYPSYVVCTSASWDTLTQTLLPQIRARIREARGKIPLLRDAQMESWYPLGRDLDNWGIVSGSPQRPENLAGRHNQHVMVIVDEASGLAPEIMLAVHGITTRPEDRIVLSGNPLDPSGPFYDAFVGQGSDMWEHHHLSALDSPNVKSRSIIVPGMATVEWVDDRRREWGEDSAEFAARVKGDFPTEGQLTVISRTMIEAAIKRADVEIKGIGKIIMGVDTAITTAGDETVMVIRDDVRTLDFIGLRMTDEDPRMRGEAVRLIQEWKPSAIYIDAQGAKYLPGQLLEAGYPVHAVRFGGEAHDRERFSDTRAEMYFQLRDALKGGFAIESNLGKKLIAEAGIQRLPTSDGRNRIEPKDKIKERIGRSTDYMDALALTFAERPGSPALPHATSAMQIGNRPTVHAEIEEGKAIYELRYEGMPLYIGNTRTAQSGYLMRGFWLSEPCAVVFIHVDNLGSWCVFDAIEQLSYETSEDWAGRVIEASRVSGKWHHYRYDWGWSDGSESDSMMMGDLMLRLSLRRGWDRRVPMPGWVASEKMKGNGGMAMINKLTAAATAGRGQGLYSWTVEVTDAVMRAVENPATGSSEKAGLVVGGPLLKALRVLAVEWNPALHRPATTSFALQQTPARYKLG